MSVSKLIGAVSAAMMLAAPAFAQGYPERQVTMIVPFAAGGPTDTVARLVAERMSADLGQQVTPAFEDRQIYHTGSWGGFRNLMLYQPDADVTVIVLSNNYHLRDQVFLFTQQGMAEALGRPFPTGLHR